MKIFLSSIIGTLFILLTGCAKHNAFKQFHMSATQERNEDNIQTFKIKKDKSIHGIVTVVYLNKVFPKIYKDNEYFYVYYYLKDKDEKASFFLNNRNSLLREKLPKENKFAKLTSFQAPWSNYYLIGFQKEDNILNLTVKTNKAASATLQFIKDK